MKGIRPLTGKKGKMAFVFQGLRNWRETSEWGREATEAVNCVWMNWPSVLIACSSSDAGPNERARRGFARLCNRPVAQSQKKVKNCSIESGATGRAKHLEPSPSRLLIAVWNRIKCLSGPRLAEADPRRFIRNFTKIHDTSHPFFGGRKKNYLIFPTPFSPEIEIVHNSIF